jgi:3-oxoadipate enol-lactonase
MTLAWRPGAPGPHDVVDDQTDPWRRDVPWVARQHGDARSHCFFKAWVPHLSRHFRVIRPDLRGFGNSPRLGDPDREMTVEAPLADVDAVTRLIGDAGPVHDVGESPSGIMPVLLPPRYLGRLRSLTLLSSPLSFPEPTQRAFACGLPSWTEA